MSSDDPAPAPQPLPGEPPRGARPAGAAPAPAPEQRPADGGKPIDPKVDKPPRSRRGLWIGIATVLVVGGGIALWRFLGRGTIESDDAFVDAHVVHLAFSVAGRVQAVHVEDNQHLEPGAAIAEIDPATYAAALAQAKAQLATAQARREAAIAERSLAIATFDASVKQARAELEGAKARAASAKADVAAAQATAERAESDRKRFETLAQASATAQQRELARTAATAAAAQLEAAKTAAGAADAAMTAADARVAAAEAGSHQVESAGAEVASAEAAVAAAQAQVDARQVDLDSTRLVAPFAGAIARKQVEPGAYAQVGMPVTAFVSDEVWVTANLKETEVGRVRPGQKATLHVDALGRDFAGRVDSLQAGAGAAFSLLPPENATGNYVKVVQRVPVKIVFTDRLDPALRLGPGMSVVASVEVE